MSKTSTTISSTDLAQSLAKRQDLSQSKSRLLLRELFLEIAEAAKAGSTVTIHGFGSFEFRERKSRVGRNPKTGEAVQVPPRRMLAFRAARANRAQEPEAE